MPAGRPKLDEVTRLMRSAKRLVVNNKELEKLIKKDPDGPVQVKFPSRPPVKYKVRLERNNKKIDGLIAAINELRAERGEDLLEGVGDLGKIKDPYKNTKVGKPRRTKIGEIEYKIRQKRQRIERIKNGDEEKAERRVSENGKPLGRAPKSNEEKIERLESQIRDMELEVADLEAELSGIELEELALDRLRLLAANARRAVKAEGLESSLVHARNDFESAKNTMDAVVLHAVALERAVAEKANRIKFLKANEQ